MFWTRTTGWVSWAGRPGHRHRDADPGGRRRPGGSLSILVISAVVPLAIGLLNNFHFDFERLRHVQDATISSEPRRSRQSDGRPVPIKKEKYHVKSICFLGYSRDDRDWGCHCFLLLAYMWLVLQRVAQTLDDPDEGKSEGFGNSFVGAMIAVIASSLAIAAYGFAPHFFTLE